ncbi:hypothetical protein SLEP1_g29402 [Rubroshorea leprosula]|uniref:Uncharacterized protein n=1 Tax=Rubroshorea leprosula TaxID=152421 RepID=A0AAV5K8B8_9ROSI|nr:hypothetical protein SLEP1_g29402 [Rubroshorea leprosula]
MDIFRLFLKFGISIVNYGFSVNSAWFCFGYSHDY